MNTIQDGHPEKIDQLIKIIQTPSPSDLNIAKGISIIEDFELNISDLNEITALSTTSNVLKIGVTGSPGAGKSTFLNGLVELLEGGCQKIAILAVDPSSHFSHGAILGDRIRMTNSVFREGVYFRSLATRGAFGGVTRTIESIASFLTLVGFDLIFIETVGVGQNEVNIVNVADRVIHVLDATTGDDIQISKAGIMEIGDIYFINKSDLIDNSAFETRLRGSRHNEPSSSGNKSVIIVGSAQNRSGIAEVLIALGVQFGVTK